MKISYSSEFPMVLAELQSTLAISTYETGLVVLISSINGKFVNQFAKKFKRPMGIAVGEDNRIAVACKDTVEVFGTHRKLSLKYKKEPGKYDALFFPRATYYTGMLDIHDIDWVNGSLMGVNTVFSSICKINDQSSFQRVWQPSFISESVPEDRCHLNGFTSDGTKSYVTLLGATNEKQGWRKNKLESGILMQMENEQVIAENLPMPHSPKLIDGKLFYLLSAIGEIRYYDFEKKENCVFAKDGNFVRGLCNLGDYLFVGFSAIRENSTSFGELPVSSNASKAGVSVYKLSTGSKVAEFTYEEKVKEIYDVSIFPNLRSVAILDKAGKIHSRAIYENEDLYFWKKEEKKKEKIHK